MDDASSVLSPTSIAMLAVSLVIGWLVVVVRSHFQKPKLNYPPHPEPCHFLWGNAPEFPDVANGYHIDPKMLEWAKEMGPVYTLNVPIIGKMICVADPKLIKHVTISKNFDKSWTYRNNLPIFGKHSIVVAHGETWKRHRKTFSPGFTPNFLKDMVSVICDKMERYMKALDGDVQQNLPTDMMERAQTFTSDVIVQIAFGEDWGGDTPHAARGYMTDIATITNRLGNDIKAKLFGFGIRSQLRDLESKLNEVMEHVLDRRLKEDKEASSDVCSLAIEAMKQKDGTLTPEDREIIIHQLKTFYFAGHDTTATTIAWAGWLLSQHPKVLSKLRDELASKRILITCGQRPTYQELQNCEYLDAVVKEVLRLYPPAGSARYTSDLNETWNGYTIGGAVLYVNCYVTHRLPQYWDRPDDFVPERFVGVAPETYSHKYIPFLKGPRDCLGRYFALLEAKLAIAALAQRYNMTCVDPKEMLGSCLTARPRGGAKVLLKVRNGDK